jgi:glyoxylase-like metal-dependent hydrolase (beta-lactamase superfamily II)
MGIHTDNTKKSGFDALETLGQIDPDRATYFNYETADGIPVAQLIRYPEVDFDTTFLLKEDEPKILHSSFCVDNFYFADRIDEFAVIEPDNRVLFIDVGLYDLCGVDFLDGALKQANVAWSDAEVFLTHAHDDHDGNVRYCLDKGARRIYVGDLVDYNETMVDDYLTMSGLARLNNDDLRFYVERLLKRDSIFDGYEDRIRTVKNGDAIEIGKRRFEVLETPGHTPEHISLLEREEGILFAGDHILDTAPGLMSYFIDLHLLKRFLESFDYLKALNLKKIYMCHHDQLIGTDQINMFLTKIVESYDRPVNKMFDLVEEDPLTIEQLARKYYSYLPSWIDQPLILLTRRVSIAFSYLEYLYDLGKVNRRVACDGALEYWRV